MFNYSETKNAVRKLQNNEQNIGKEILRQKYRKPYEALLHEIAKQTGEMIALVSVQAIESAFENKSRIPEQLWKKMVEDIKRIKEEEEKAGTFDKIMDAIFGEYDLDKAMEIAFQRLGIRNTYEALPPVWLYFCHQIVPGWQIKNDLTGMRWIPAEENGAAGFWEKKNDDGTHMIRFDLPPTWEEIAKEYEQVKARGREV